MKDFFAELLCEFRQISWRVAVLLGSVVVAIYGMLAVAPATAFDFASAKGSGFKVFLTYYFMHRPVRGAISAFFPDFTPFWNAIVGILFLYLSVCLMFALFKRMKFSKQISVLGAVLFVATPFFFNFSVYQHVMPAGALAFCFDAVAFLAFQKYIISGSSNLRRWPIAFVSIVASAMATGVYQAHANLLLTGMLGVCALTPRRHLKEYFADVFNVIWVLAAAVALWGVVCYGPVAIAKVIGFVIPKSGGCHDEIYWVSSSHSFCETLKSLGVGFLINWVYNAFFIVGLRCMLAVAFLCLLVAIVRLVCKEVSLGLPVLIFVLSVFAFPVLQGSAANLRTHYCLIALISFGCMIVLRAMDGCKKMHALMAVIFAFFAFEMGQETATLYYYNWKLKHHDEMHMSVIAHDLWAQYGLNINKPVAVVGGWKDVNTCWEDMRPFQELSLVNKPYSTYSNVNDDNVAREFYMVAREKVGLVVPMPDIVVYDQLRIDKTIQMQRPAYPQHGYIFETNNVIVVNLGANRTPWPAFRYRNYASPNELLIDEKLGMNRLTAWIYERTEIFRELADLYAWALKY